MVDLGILIPTISVVVNPNSESESKRHLEATNTVVKAKRTDARLHVNFAPNTFISLESTLLTNKYSGHVFESIALPKPGLRNLKNCR